MLTDLHMHSNYSDGLHTPEEMIEAAIGIGYEAVAITDHVWRTSAWVPAYANHLERLKLTYRNKIRVYSGIEAKVLTLDGDIDADPSFYPLVDLVLGSIHRIPKPGGFYASADAAHTPKSRIAEHWLAAFDGMLNNPNVDIIAHPLSELVKFGIDSGMLPIPQIADRIAISGKILELNVRYNSPDEPIIRHAAERGVPFLISSDSHSVDALVRNSRLVRAYSERGFRIADVPCYLADKDR